MIWHLVTTTAVAALLAGGVALAQTQPDNAPPQPPAAQPQMQDVQPDKQTPGGEADKTDKSSDAATSDMKLFIAEQQNTDWLSSTLVGSSVEGQDGEALGEVSDLILAENGDISAVVISVGGFLGIGAKNVAVPFDALIFEDRTDANRQAAAAGGAPNPAQPGSSAPPSQQGSAARGGAGADSVAMSPAEEAAERQGNTVIVLAVNKEALDAAPSFKHLKTLAAEARSQRDRQQLDNNAARGATPAPRPAQ